MSALVNCKMMLMDLCYNARHDLLGFHFSLIAGLIGRYYCPHSKVREVRLRGKKSAYGYIHKRVAELEPLLVV
jgi:hypothetical protein